MNGQRMQEPYLVHYEQETEGKCRFCHEKTRDAVFPPEILDEVKTPVFVCGTCRETNWVMESLKMLFNRSIVEQIIPRSQIPVVPLDLQLDVTSLSPSWITGSAMRVFVYFLDGDTRFLTTKKWELEILGYVDVTQDFRYLTLGIPELDGTILDAQIYHGERPVFIELKDCLRYRDFDIRNVERSVRLKALDKCYEIIGERTSWRVSKQ
ncbi:MAG: hypothetical protein ACTSWQ_10975 [Candidatus Thorarchaeota archaeon]